MSKDNLKKKSKLNTENQISRNMEKTIMQKIDTQDIKMKPKWVFVAASIFSFTGLIGLSVLAIFLINLILFLVNKNGPGYGKLDMMFDSFPLWIPVLAAVLIGIGIWMLHKYDFSYKNNFVLIVIGFILSIVIAAIFIDNLGLNTIWSQKGVMKKFYQQIESPNQNYQRQQQQFGSNRIRGKNKSR